MSSRRSRRRRERGRSGPGPSDHRLSLPTRLGIGLVGGGLVAAGALLLAAGAPGTAARLGRVAGILILLGLVGIAAAAIGHV